MILLVILYNKKIYLFQNTNFLNSIIKKIDFIKIFYVTNNLFSTMKGVVYKLYCMDETITEIYVGSTMNIKDRMWSHKSRCNIPHDKAYNYKVYRFIRANGGWFNWNYKILEECDVEDKAELEGCYEDTWIVNLNPQLNSNRARRTRAEYERDNSGRQAEYYQQNKTKVTAQHKEYYHEHKEKINTRRQEKVPCECGGYYTRGHKSHHERTKKHLSKLNL